MSDLLLNTTSEVAIYLEFEGTPVTDRTVTLSLFSPRGAEVLTNVVAGSDGTGWNSYAVAGTLLNVRGTWRVEWTAPGVPLINAISYHSCGSVRRGSLTLADLRKRIAREAGMVVHEGQINGGATATAISDDGLVFGANGEFAGCWLLVTSGPGIAEERRVTAFDAATKTLTVAPALSAAPGEGVRYLLLEMGPLRPVAIVDAVNDAIGSLSDRAHIERQDESLLTIADQAEYDIPDGFTALFRVDIYNSDDAVYEEVNPSDWAIDGTLLQLVSAPDESDLTIRLHGTTTAEGLYWDSQYCELLPEFVVAHAIESLHASMGGGQQTDPDDHRRAQAFYASKAEAYRKRAIGRIPANTRTVG